MNQNPQDKNPTALEERKTSDDARLFSPSVARNRDPILDVLRPHLKPGHKVLEIACGTGEHGAHIMSQVDGLTWQPSDFSEEARISAQGWVDFLGNPNFLSPIKVDATSTNWPVDDGPVFDEILCMNMIHISPFEAAKGVICGAGTRLAPGGLLFFYGPFKRGGKHTAPSNETFDQSLKSRDPSWGIRDFEEIVRLAKAEGLELESVTEMPANNLSVLFRRKGERDLSVSADLL
jgi:SAM-dependent methyltransferase